MPLRAAVLLLSLIITDMAKAQNVSPVPANPGPQLSGTAPRPNTLQDGTAIKLRLAENLTSATAKTGQKVAFEAVEEIDVEGVAIIAKGAQAIATITTAEPRRSMGRGGKLDVNVVRCALWMERKPL